MLGNFDENVGPSLALTGRRGGAFFLHVTEYLFELRRVPEADLVLPTTPRKASGSAEGRQARPERFEAMICASAQAIDLPLGGRGRLAGSIGAYPGHICRESP